jgi:hypothetical protein
MFWTKLKSDLEILVRWLGVLDRADWVWRWFVKSKVPTLFGLFAGFLLVSTPLFAHHGQAAYDLTKKLTVKGSVTDFTVTNPHAHFSFDAKDDKGKVQNWTMELSTPLMLMRTGWTRTVLKPGDAVTVTFYPSKNGAGLGYLDNVVLADGTMLYRGGSTHLGEQGVSQ